MKINNRAALWFGTFVFLKILRDNNFKCHSHYVTYRYKRHVYVIYTAYHKKPTQDFLIGELNVSLFKSSDIVRRPQSLKKSSIFFLKLLNNFITKWEIFSIFCGLLRISELEGTIQRGQTFLTTIWKLLRFHKAVYVMFFYESWLNWSKYYFLFSFILVIILWFLTFRFFRLYF